MCVTACSRIRNPARLARRPRQSAIKRHAALCDDERFPSDYPLIERLVQPGAFFGQNAFPYVDARISQFHDASAGVTRIHVYRADHYIFNSSLDNRIRARRSASGRRARLESHIKRGRTKRAERRRGQAFDLRVRQTPGPMVAARDHTLALDENRSYHRIRARASNPATRTADGPISTPRRDCPRSSGTPMTRILRPEMIVDGGVVMKYFVIW